MILLLALAGCVAPGLVCTEMYAPSNLVIELDHELEDGDWEVHVDDQICSFQVPGSDWECEDAQHYVRLDSDPVALYLEEQAPEQVEVQVYRDEVLVAEESFTPEYTEDEPNGEGCGVREQGSVVLSW